MRAPVHRARSEYADALRRCASVAPIELWPPQFVHMIIESPSTLEYTERMRAACFLFGNGCSANDVRAILLHRMRDKSARGNLEWIVRRLDDPSHALRHYFFDVHHRVWTYMNGHRAEWNRSIKRVMLHSWEQYCARRATYPSLVEQERFFGQTEVVEASLFFDA